MMSPRYATAPGRPHPLGAIPDAGGVNFSVFFAQRHGRRVAAVRRARRPEPAQIIKLDPAVNKTFFFWHVYVKGLRPGAHYAYRVDGPTDLHGQGFRYNPNKVLIDPYACGNTDALWNRADACGPERQPGHLDAERGHRHVRLRLAGRPAAGPADERAGHLRDARGRLHAASVVGRQASRHLLRGRREDSLPEGVGDHRRGAAAGDGVRPQGSAADEARRQRPADELLGLQHGQLLRPGVELLRRRPSRGRTSASSATWSRPCTAPGSR